MSTAKTSRSAKTAEKRKVATKATQQPQQERAHDTYELIVKTTGDLLDEIGLERLSTNLVCKRAGLTPPALYRYFPNKYAILRELGDRLMALQDDAVLEWIDKGGLKNETYEAAVASNVRLQECVNDITRKFPGNIFVLRALRSVPILREVRIASRDLVAERMADAIAAAGHTASRERLLEAACLTTELMYSGMEMVLEEPNRDGHGICVDLARMMVAYYDQLEG